MLKLQEHDGAVTFRLRVQPRARSTGIAGEHDGALKLKVASPPVDGKANSEIIRYLAKIVGVRQSAVEIVSGATSRDKVVRIQGVTAAVLLTVLSQTVGIEDR